MLLRVISTGSRIGNCYALESEAGEILLLDFGCKSKTILRGINYKISDVVGALLTHEHGDHSKSYEWLMQNGIDIYTNDETADKFEVVTGEKMKGRPENIPFKIKGFTVIPFYVPHTTRDNDTSAIIECPNFGYMILHEEMGKLVYITDMEYCPFSFKKQRVNHFLIECNHMDNMLNKSEAKYEHVIRGHASLSVTKGIIKTNKSSDLRNVILCHLSDLNADPHVIYDEIREESGSMANVVIAEPGYECKLSEYPF